MSPSVFLNLSNHPCSSWSPAQLEAARALGFGEPTDPASPMPLVPPEASEEEVDTLAEALAEQAVRQRAAAAHVSGEFSLTVALVRALQVRGIACFTATTHRDAREVLLPGGEVRREHVFRFIRWRRYRER